MEEGQEQGLEKTVVWSALCTPTNHRRGSHRVPWGTAGVGVGSVAARGGPRPICGVNFTPPPSEPHTPFPLPCPGPLPCAPALARGPTLIHGLALAHGPAQRRGLTWVEGGVCPRHGCTRRGVPPPTAAVAGRVVLPLRLRGQLLVPQEQLKRAWGVN